MSILSQLNSEEFIDLPDCLKDTFEFQDQLSAMGLSHHGFILGIGFQNGDFTLLNSQTGYNRKNFTGFSQSPILSVSFPRDTRTVLLGDQSGLLTLLNIETEKIDFQSKFEGKILKIEFHPHNPDISLILVEKQLFLFTISTHESIQIPGEFSSALWNETGTSIIVSSKADLLFFDIDSSFHVQNLDNPQRYPTNAKRGIVGLAISPTYRNLVVIDKAGSARIFDLRHFIKGKVIQDVVNHSKITSAIFDRFGENLIVSCLEHTEETFSCFDVSTGQLVRSYFDGPKSGILQLLFDPLSPTLFVRSSYCIYKWMVDTRYRNRKSAPTDTLLLTNVLYDEKESEFDKEEEEEITPSEHPLIDVFTPQPFTLYPDDINYPNQIIQLPVNPNFFK